jgi:hypothetical protein
VSDWSAGDSSSRASKAVSHATGQDPIHIQKSKQGSLHSALGVPQGKPIPASKESIKPGDSPALRKKKQFAINAKKWGS